MRVPHGRDVEVRGVAGGVEQRCEHLARRRGILPVVGVDVDGPVEALEDSGSSGQRLGQDAHQAVENARIVHQVPFFLVEQTQLEIRDLALVVAVPTRAVARRVASADDAE